MVFMRWGAKTVEEKRGKAKEGRFNRLEPANVAVGVRYDESERDISSSLFDGILAAA